MKKVPTITIRNGYDAAGSFLANEIKIPSFRARKPLEKNPATMNLVNKRDDSVL